MTMGMEFMGNTQICFQQKSLQNSWNVCKIHGMSQNWWDCSYFGNTPYLGSTSPLTSVGIHNTFTFLAMKSYIYITSSIGGHILWILFVEEHKEKVGAVLMLCLGYFLKFLYYVHRIPAGLWDCTTHKLTSRKSRSCSLDVFRDSRYQRKH